jgi:hypothetical protein
LNESENATGSSNSNYTNNNNYRNNHGVSSITFLHLSQQEQQEHQEQQCSIMNSHIIQDDHDGSDDDDDDDDEIDDLFMFQCKSKLLLNTKQQQQQQQQQQRQQHNNFYQDSKAIDQATIFSFSHNSNITKNNSTLNNYSYLASSHVNGQAYIWDLYKRCIAFPLLDYDHNLKDIQIRNSNHNNHNQNGPGLAIFQLKNHDVNDNNNNNIHNHSPKLVYQTRDVNGTISIHQMTSTGCQIIDVLHCKSQTFCHAIGIDENVIASPSNHESIVSLWDLRMGGGSGRRPICILHGSGLDLKLNSNPSDWRKDGMVMSLQCSHWGNIHHDYDTSSTCISSNSGGGSSSSNNDNFVLGCGMESGNVYFHDLRKIGTHCHFNTGDYVTRGSNTSEYMHHCGSSKNCGDDELMETINCTNCTSIHLGMNPVLSIDMQPSIDKPKPKSACVTNITKNTGPTFHTTTRTATTTNNGIDNESFKKTAGTYSSSFITVAGTAGDANEQFDLSESERGTVNIIKTTKTFSSSSSSSAQEQEQYTTKCRIRAKVGTCNILSNDDHNDNNLHNNDNIKNSSPSFMGKPGVNICKFNPNGSCFAVGGWDKRVRIFSRTKGTLLGILRGPNEDSITALDWWSTTNANGFINHSNVLAAGSADGKITIWRC